MEFDDQLLDKCLKILEDLKKDLVYSKVAIRNLGNLIHDYECLMMTADEIDIMRYSVKKVIAEIDRDKEIKNQEDTEIEIMALKEFIEKHYPDAEI